MNKKFMAINIVKISSILPSTVVQSYCEIWMVEINILSWSAKVTSIWSSDYGMCYRIRILKTNRY